MDGRFDPRLSSIFVFGELTGPKGRTHIRLAVDTGATRTVIRTSILQYLGYVNLPSTRAVRMTTASGVVPVALIDYCEIKALGQTRTLSVVSHELPDTFEGHGLLGRDFFLGMQLTIDFSRNEIFLRPPPPRWQFWR